VNAWPPGFEAFVDAARAGRLGLWRFAFGIAAIGIVGGLGLFGVAFIWLVALLVRNDGLLPEDEVQEYVGSLMSGDSPGAVALVLTAWAALWLGTWIAVRLFQRRRLATLFNAGARIFWSDFLRAAVATLVAALLIEGVSILLGAGPVISRGTVSLDRWLIWLLPVAAAAFVQTTAEEIVFRGYMLQTLAARFRSPWVWVFVPFLLFVAIHFDFAASAPINFLAMAFAGAFALVATMLVWRTGNLGAAMGMHFLNNFLAFSLIGNEGFLSGEALFLYPPTGALTLQQIFLSIVASIVSLGLAALFLLEPRSPLRLKSLDLDPTTAPVAKIGE
jgi:membrane protease YdiL (CAAX protease family)